MSLALSTALLSAFLDNLTTVLLMVPITFLLADALDIDPIPLVLIEIIASNIGGTATLIGDPPNILIAGATGLSFADVRVEPRADRGGRLPRGDRDALPRLPQAPADRARGARPRPRARRAPSRSRTCELKRTLPVLVITILAFFVHKPLGLEPATVALTGATAMLLLTRQSVEEALRGIEWPTLFFFIGLFVMVGALEERGAIKEIADGIAAVTDGNRSAELLGILWVSALGSGVVDNIPFTATMIPVVEELQGGSAATTPTGGRCRSARASAGTSRSSRRPRTSRRPGMAERAGRPIGFMTFLRVGVPATLLSMVLATGYVALRYL